MGEYRHKINRKSMANGRVSRWRMMLAPRRGGASLLWPIAIAAFVGGCVPPTAKQTARGAFESWLEDNQAAYEAFKREAKARAWAIYVQTYEYQTSTESIGVLDLANSSYRSIYRVSPGNRIVQTTDRVEGRIAFVEAREKVADGRVQRSDFSLKIAADDGAVEQIELDAAFDEQGPGGLDLGASRVLLAAKAGKVYLYDMDSGMFERVFGGGDGGQNQRLWMVRLMGDRFLLLITGQQHPERLVVLQGAPPYEPLAVVEGVSGVAVIGRHLIAEAIGGWFVYDPTGQRKEQLPGRPVLRAPGDDKAVLGDVPAELLLSSGGRVYQYNLDHRSENPLWRAARPIEHYDFTSVFLSPDGRFLFVPWHVPPRTHGELHLGRVMEYEVYDLTTGEKRGAFLNPYAGKFSFHFLGWVKRDEDQE